MGPHQFLQQMDLSFCILFYLLYLVDLELHYSMFISATHWALLLSFHLKGKKTFCYQVRHRERYLQHMNVPMMFHSILFINQNQKEMRLMENWELYVFFHFAVCNKNKLLPLGLNYSNESLSAAHQCLLL